MVDKNDSLLREVEDELRNDQLKKLWNDYGTYVLGAALAFVAAVGIYQIVDHEAIAAFHIADDMHHFGHIRLRAAFIDYG